MPPKKRNHDASNVIDLTGDDEPSSGPAPKRQAGAPRGGRGGRGGSHHLTQRNGAANWRTSTSSQPGAGGSRVYPSPAASSQPSRSQSQSQSQSQSFEEQHIDLTQAEDPDIEFYGSLDTKIVGVRYYNGFATAGEFVNAEREPGNPYDSNAILVTNVMCQQIGHIPRNVASKLAPYMDRGEIHIEARLSGEKQFYDCPLRADIYGPSDPTARFEIEQNLKKDKILKATQLKHTKKEAEARRKVRLGILSSQTNIGLGDDGNDQDLSAAWDDLMKQSEAIDKARNTGALKKLALGEDELAKMPIAEQPASLKSTLLPYQLQGLAWMLAKESPQLPPKGTDESVQLWKWHNNGRDMCNIATKYIIKGQAKLLSGGILADDMGLGKTLQIISLILSGTGSGPTLIIAPVSVMSNWEQQIKRHVLPDKAPSVLIYHSNNAKGPVKFEKYGVVVTSYGKLNQENSSPGPLLKTKWRRVVLDEAHTIRNPRTVSAMTACLLQAESRWALTGTPIVNNVTDLQSLLLFLRLSGGLEQPSLYNSIIKRPLSYGEPEAEILLQHIMHDLCLRRNKDMKFVDLKLPPKTEYVHRITFRDDEKSKYNALMNEAKFALENYRNTTSPAAGQFQNVLERLLRLRQICNHWTLCRQRVDELLKTLEKHDVVPLNNENKALLQEALRLFVENQEECPICFDTLSSPVITHCKHVFCRGCIDKVIEMQGKCPMCRNALDADKLLEPLPEDAGTDESFDPEMQSSKTEALLKILQATLKDPEAKVIIFSQWTSFLNVIQAQVAAAGYKYTRIDGSMKAEKRDQAIAALDGDPDTTILLASLAVCSVGLNLVSANTVVLADSWWAPAIEDQAVDRVHRLGQQRPTTIWRLVMEGSVEERVLDIQSEKRELVGKAFREKGKGKKSKETRMADVMKLLS